GFVRNRLVGPYLAVRVRIAAAHHLAAIFEDLDVLELRVGTQFDVLVCPKVDYTRDFLDAHSGECQVMSGGETQYSASSGFALSDQEIVIVEFCRFNIGL